MDIRKEFRLSVAIVAMVQILTAFGAIALLERVSPAVGEVVTENVVSLEAAEEMLAALALARFEDRNPANREEFDSAYRRAFDNVTEEDERPVLESIRILADPAFAGDDFALRQMIVELRRLTEINRGAVQSVEREARRLGNAGAWAMVTLGLLGFLISRFVSRRLERRLLRPVTELYTVLHAMRSDHFRRCETAGAAPDVASVLSNVNALLDERLPALADS